MTYPELVRKCVTAFQSHVTKLRVHIYDGISRFSGVVLNMFTKEEDTEFVENSFISRVIKLDFRYLQEQHHDMKVSDFLNLVNDASYQMIEHNKNVAENTLVDKVNIIINQFLPIAPVFRDQERRKKFYLCFSEAAVDSSELGKILNKDLGDLWRKIETLFVERSSDKSVYAISEDDRDNILNKEQDDRLFAFLSKQSALLLKDVLHNETRRTNQGARFPYKDPNLYATMKTLFIMLILGNLRNFHSSLNKIEMASMKEMEECDDEDEDPPEYTVQWIPKMSYNQDIDPTQANERLMSK